MVNHGHAHIMIRQNPAGLWDVFTIDADRTEAQTLQATCRDEVLAEEVAGALGRRLRGLQADPWDGKRARYPDDTPARAVLAGRRLKSP